MSADRSAVQLRRWQVLLQLDRAGDAGLSFVGLFNRVKSLLADAGDETQQHAALRNSLSVLKGHGYVQRAVGLWVLTSEGKERVQVGRDGGGAL